MLLFSPIILKLGMERGLDEGAALWSVVLGSVGSAAGRLLMPLLSDRIGRRPTDLILFGVSLGLSAVFLFAQGWLVVAVYAGLTFCYSALAAVLPSLSTDLFGLPHAGVNYGFLALGQSVGSLAFPLRRTSGALPPGGTGWPWQARRRALCVSGRSGLSGPNSRPEKLNRTAQDIPFDKYDRNVTNWAAKAVKVLVSSK